MATRTERLNRLVIQAPCRASWGGMSESGSGRFCPRCNRHVHDLAAMEAREVEALVEATHGRFCARLTRDRAGRLVTRPPVPPPAPPDLGRRASPVAAAVVGALVGLSGTAWAGTAAPAEPAAPAPAPAAPAASPATPPAEAPPETARPAQDRAPGAGIAGRALDQSGAPLPGVTVVVRDADHRERTIATGADGSFAFEGLPAGVYTLEAQIEGFMIPSEPNLSLQPGSRHEVALTGEPDFGAITGAVAVTEQSLLSAYRESSLVVIATVGPSLPLAETDQGSFGSEVRTELQVTAVLKGTLCGSTVQVDRMVYEGDESSSDLGATLLAFLVPAEDDAAHGGPLYAATDDFGGLRQLPADATGSYRERLRALARLGEEPRADELLEWLVATAEDEHTRKEAVGDLRWAVESLTSLEEEWAERRVQPGGAELDAQTEADRLLAQAGEPGEEVEPEVLGALLTPHHRKRLSRALLATERLTQPDLALFDLVRPWAGPAALRWLAERLADDAAEGWAARQAMGRLAEVLEDEGLQKLLDEADHEIEAAYDASEDETAEPDEIRQERLAAQVEAIEQKLRKNFLRALGDRP